ncbi:hypothetical protein B0H12DRAFT_1246749 [Mycena haematopus]|nr:hypothetical protein B0H12DRAFT_1246749 [Mycena haematopus]
MPEHSAQLIGHAPLNDRSRGGPSSPIEHAFAPQPEYQFTLRPVQSGTPQASIPIDPALLALPGGADLDLRDGPTITNARTSTSRSKKPTGSASCPPEVKQAHEIEDLINQQVGTRELSDVQLKICFP